jgi:Abortive infection C-terminus
LEKFQIPAHLISALSSAISEWESHTTMDNLFRHANVSGNAPEGNKLSKAQQWLERVNSNDDYNVLEVLGYLLEGYMEVEPTLSDVDFFSDKEPSLLPWQQERIDVINKALARANLQYSSRSKVIRASGSASRSLKDIIPQLDYISIDQEFNRALKNIEVSPRDAVSAACNILESIFKTYIEEEGLTLPNKQDLQPIWKVVRIDLGLDSSKIEERDLLEIISGLLATVSGIGALRTHASSAHGSGKQVYNLEPRHARLAVHGAHTLATFVLESWQEKRNRKKNV